MSSEDNEKHVLEYYRKYSQNHNSPKYSGTSVSYLPPISLDAQEDQQSDNNSNKSIVELSSNIKVIIKRADSNESDDGSSEGASEHKKLEWDNGADIGYDSARTRSDQKLHKSLSLPVLSSSTELKNYQNKPVITPSTIITHSTSDENVGIYVFSSSSSSSAKKDNEWESSSSGSMQSNKVKEITLTSSSSSAQPHKGDLSSIGTHSGGTSSATTNSEDGRIKKFQENIDFLKQKIGLPGAHSTPHDDLKQKASESMDYQKSRESCKNKSDKSVQLTKPSSPTKKVETKIVELSVSTPINVNCIMPQPRNLHQEKNKAALKAVQTEPIKYENVETQYDFKAAKVSKIDCTTQVTPVNSDDVADSVSSFEYFHAVNQNVKTDGLQSKSISGLLKETCLKSSTTESSSIGKTSTEELDKNMELLEKLFKTKKMDSNTKKRYIKKLLQKLATLEISSNSSGSSSELFIPKKEKLTTKQVAFNVDVATRRTIDKTCSCKSLSSDKNKTSAELLQNQISTKDAPELLQNQISTNNEAVLENTITRVKSSCKSDNSARMPKIIGSSSRVPTGTNSNDYLLRFAENERFYQLDWINNEITHLSKLKNILEYHHTRPETSTAYTVAQPGATSSSSARTYNIQSKLDLPLGQNINYLLDGKEYMVSSSDRTSNSNGKPIIADIQVSSDERNTNIKLRTLCSMCKQVQCVCAIDTKSSSSLSNKEVLDERKPSVSAGQIMRQSGADLFSQEELDSLETVFKNCSCTSSNASCRCGFVRKLLDKFRGQRSEVNNTCPEEKSASNVKAQISDKIQTQGTDYKVDATDKSAQTGVHKADKTTESVKDNANHKCTYTAKNINIDSTFQTVKSGRDVAVQRGPKKFDKDNLTEVVNVKDRRLQTVKGGADVTVEAVPRKNDKHNSTEVVNVRERGFQTVKNGNKLASEKSQTIPIVYDKPTVMERLTMDRKTTNTLRESKDVAIQVLPETEAEVLQAETIASQTVQKLASEESQTIRTMCHKATYMEGLLTDPKTTNTLKEFKDIAVQVLPEANVEHLHDEAIASKIVQKLAPEKSETTTSLKGSKNVVIQAGTKPELLHAEAGPDTEKTIADKSVQNHPLKEDKTDKSTSTTEPKANQNETNVSLPSNNTTSSSASSSSRVTCFACKQKAFLAEVSYVQIGGKSFPICSRCYYVRHTCQHNPRFMCYCWRYRPIHCRCCRIDVANCTRRQQGLIYTITLPQREQTGVERLTEKPSEVKIQKGWSGKGGKDKKNANLRDGGGASKKESAETQSEKEEMNDVQRTLNEYLIENKPQFIYSAEYRRQMVLHSRIRRERQKDEVKLNFLENNCKKTDDGKYKLFTEREMRSINKKNFKKLPEVQNKLVRQRENRLRQAERLMSNVFAKKVQKSVLQGKDRFPIDKPLVYA